MNKLDLWNGIWADPPSLWRGAPFWSLNSKLEKDRLLSQIDEMHKGGMGGFFMHSRYGLKTPYLSEEWFDLLGLCIEKARALDLKAYLYDEDRWPSGPAGGFVTREHPELRLKYLVAGAATELKDASSSLANFEVELDEAGALKSYSKCASGCGMAFAVRTEIPSGWTNDGGYLDVLSHEAVAEYIKSTHDQYAARYGKDFGALIPGMFTDEPNYGWRNNVGADVTLQAHWTPRLPEEFKARRGYDLMNHLPELFFPAAGGAFSKVQHDYHQTITELFVENFSGQIGAWCGKERIALTGHVLLEGDLTLQTMVVGACMPHYEHMQWPGIDLLTDQAEELLTAKQCSSVADQLGKERVLTELYGCTGWDFPLEGHKFLGDWQYATGINFRCQHLTHYSLAGGAKRDYPASIINHSPWWPYYKGVEDYFARLSYMLTRGKPVRDVLVIHPIESAWGLLTPGSNQAAPKLGELEQSLRTVMFTLTGQHYDWDFGDEGLLARYGHVTADGLTVGQMSYKLVVVPPVVTLRKSTIKLLNAFVAAGGKVLFAGEQPVRCDGKDCADAALLRLLDSSANCDAEPAALIRQVGSLLPRQVSLQVDGKECDQVWAMLRQVDEGYLLFVQSHERKQPLKLEVRVEGASLPIVLWDALAGEKTLLAGEADSEGGFVLLDLPSTGSALLSYGIHVPDAVPNKPAPKVVSWKAFEGPFEYELTELNSFPLDYCDYSIDGSDFSELKPTLQVDKEFRERCGLGTRLGNEHQPWYLYALGTVDTRPRFEAVLRYKFQIDVKPTLCKLALENPDEFEIIVNGQRVGPEGGWWVSEDFRTCDLMPVLGEGETVLELRFWYRPDLELEDLYLIGDFGVKKLDAEGPSPTNMTLTKLPDKLALGSWVGQGLDFYGAAVRYKLKVARPKAGKRLRIRLPELAATMAAVHVGQQTFPLLWAPFEADITEALDKDETEVVVEVIGGRKNILGPLHTPWEPGTGPHSFSPDHPRWSFDYQLTDHGLMGPIIVEELD